MPKKYDARVIHSYKSFKIADICRLYKEQKIHPQTIRKLIKAGKLEAFEFQGEWYVYGAILKQRFENKNKGRKKALEFHQFSCRKCKAIDSPLNNTITRLTTGRGGCVVAFGICRTCGHEMNRPYKKIEEAKMREIFTIQLEQQTTLYNTSSTTKTTHFEIEQKEVVSESSESIVLQNSNQIPQNNKCTSVSTKTAHIPQQQFFLFDL
jgi:hypothetical protein